MLFVNQIEQIILCVVCVVAVACLIESVALAVWMTVNHKRKQKPERELVELNADAAAAKREFVLGEEFTCEGLTVNAIYNLEPTKKPLAAEVISADEFKRLTEAGSPNGCYIVKPNMKKAGNDIVIVKYKDKATYYPISVSEPVQEEVLQSKPSVQDEPKGEPLVHNPEPAVIEEESNESVLRYDKSFTAKFIQSNDDIKGWYTTLKNEFLSYKKVKTRMSWKHETFRMGKEVVARLCYRGNTLCLYLPLNPADYAGSRYKIEDASGYAAYGDTPCMYRLKNDKRIRLAIELFATVMEKMGGLRTDRVAEDYYLPYEDIDGLVEKGLAKSIVKSKSDEPVFMQVPAGTAANEESGEAAVAKE